MDSALGEPADRRKGSPLVGVVIVNWQRPDSTRACLRALSELSHRHWFAVVVDNGSVDFAADSARLAFPGVEFLRSEVNLGFAAGSNLGMRAALARGADWVWFLNDDAMPEPDALTELLAVAERPPYPTVLGPKIVQHARPDRLDSIALDIDLDGGAVRLLGHDEVDRGQYDEVREPVAVTG